MARSLARGFRPSTRARRAGSGSRTPERRLSVSIAERRGCQRLQGYDLHAFRAARDCSATRYAGKRGRNAGSHSRPRHRSPRRRSPASTSPIAHAIRPLDRDIQIHSPVGKEHAIARRHAESPRLRLTGGCERRHANLKTYPTSSCRRQRRQGLEGTVPRRWRVDANPRAASAGGHVEVGHPDLGCGRTSVHREVNVTLAGIDRCLTCRKGPAVA